MARVAVGFSLGTAPKLSTAKKALASLHYEAALDNYYRGLSNSNRVPLRVLKGVYRGSLAGLCIGGLNN